MDFDFLADFFVSPSTVEGYRRMLRKLLRELYEYKVFSMALLLLRDTGECYQNFYDYN